MSKIEQLKTILSEVMESIREELDNLSEEELQLFAGGYDNRGMDCVVQRWYLQDNYRENTMISAFSKFVREFDDILSKKASEVEYDEGY